MSLRRAALRPSLKDIVVRASMLIAMICMLASLAWTTSTLLHQLDHSQAARRDNFLWTILQLESEYIALRLDAERIGNSKTPDLESFRQRFDIFYSRIGLFKTGRMAEELKQSSFFLQGIARIDRLLSNLVPLFDADDAKLIDARPRIVALLEINTESIKSFVLDAIAHFADVSDTSRNSLYRLLGSLAFIVVTLIALQVLVIALLRRRSQVLEHRTRELLQSQARMKATVESALDAVIAVDAQGRILEFNDQAAACFGYSVEMAVGQPLTDLIIPERHRAAHAAGMKRFLENGEARILGKRVEIEALHAKGHEFPVELAVGVAKGLHEPIFVAYARDITERKRDAAELDLARKNAEAAAEAKSRFLATMSHEMRTPLNGILGVMQLMRATPLTEEQRRLIDTADSSGEVLLDLINDVLDFSKMEAGKLNLSIDVFSIRKLLDDVRNVLSIEAEQQGNHLSVDINLSLPEMLVGDAKRLKQVILNLGFNACKFTRDGSINISIVGQETGLQTVALVITVEDTGIGIPKGKMEVLFSEFSTIEDSYNRRQGGTGLGLAICRQLIDLMGGRIRAESEEGVGSRFSLELTLPIATMAATSQDRETSDSLTPEPELNGTVLLVEDNATNAMIAARMLTNAGLVVRCASDGYQALRELQRGAIDLVFMDISLPGLDGMEITRRLRDMPPPLGDMTVVAMTAHALNGDREMFLAAGMNDYLAKPVRKSELLAMLRKHLKSPVMNSREESSSCSLTTRDAVGLDRSAVDALGSEIGWDVVPVILQEYVKEARERVEAISDAEMRHDVAELRRLAHALSGSSSTVGAICLGMIAKDVELACKAGHVNEAISRLPFLRMEQAKVIEDCEQLMREASDGVADVLYPHIAEA